MTGSATAVLVRWSKGHVYVGGGGSELYVNMAAVASKKQALAFGASILDGQGGTLSTLAVQGPAYWSPDGGPHYPPSVLSDYEGRRVVGYTADMSTDETTVVTPTLNDPVADAREALRRRIERASADTVSLWGSPRREGIDQGSGSGTSPPEFSVAGPLFELFEPDDDDEDEDDPRDSPWWRPQATWCGSWVSATLKKPGATATNVQFLRVTESNNAIGLSVLSNCYIPGGKRRGVSVISPNDRVAAGQACLMRVAAYGAGAAGLTASVHGAPL